MPETGSQILSYTGSKELGQGSNAGIPVIGNPNLDVINDTAKNITFLNHDNNIKLYDQKIKDRDAALQLLQQGSIQSGAIDPNDRPYYDTAKKNVQDSFYKMMQNGGINNTSAYKDYLQNVDDLKNVVTQAQGRNIELAKLNEEKSQQSLPEDISAYDNHIQQQKQKSFWQPIDPFQKAFDYNIGQSTADVTGQPITAGQLGVLGTGNAATGTTTWNSTTNKNGVITQKQTTKNAPLKTGLVNNKNSKNPITIQGQQAGADGNLSPYSYTPEQYYDLPTIQKNVDENYASNPTDRFTYQSYFNDIQDPNKLPPEEALKTMQSYNNRIADYDTQRGVKPDGVNADQTPHYPDQIKYTKDPQTGRLIIQETPASFFAKHALASINGDYVQKPEAIFNKDVGNFLIQKEKANSDSFYKHAMAGAANTKAGAYAANLHQQMKIRGTAAEQDNFLNEVYNKNIVQQPLITGRGNNNISLSNISAQNSLPVFTLEGKTPKQLIPIGSTAHYPEKAYTTDSDGKKILTKNAQPDYYEGGHYEPQYIFNGKPVSVDEITGLYKTFKNNNPKWDGSLEGFLKGYINSPQQLMKVKLKGANGSTDADLSLAAQRIISNQTTKKGQMPAFDNTDATPPSEDQIPDNTDNQQ